MKKTVNVKAHSRLTDSGHITSVDAHVRQLDGLARAEIKHYVRMREGVIDKFIDENSLDPQKVLAGMKSKKIKTGEIATAIVGNPGNAIFKKLVKTFKR